MKSPAPVLATPVGAAPALPLLPGLPVAAPAPAEPRSRFDLELPSRPSLRLPRRRTVVIAVVLGVPLVVLAIRFRSEVARQFDHVPAPNWAWLTVCVAATVLFYVANAVALRAGAGVRFGLAVATAVQCAAAAANRIVPAGLGAIAVNLRFLERRGLSRSAGIATIASTKIASGVVHIGALALIAALVGDSRLGDAILAPVRGTLASIGVVPLCATVAGLLAAVVILCTLRWTRNKLRAPLRTFRAHMRALSHSPSRSAGLCASLAGTKLAQVVALVASERAFGGQVGFVSVAAVYLVGTTVAGAAPTAGNVGAIEPALAIGLTAAGGAAGPMVAAVLVFRLITYWLPVLPGIVALTALRRRGDL